jgi:ribosomal protein S18 acetylase RimI-like enzyme
VNVTSSVRAKKPAFVVRQARSEDGPTLQRIDAASYTPEISPALAPDPDGDFFGHGTSPEDVLVAEVDDTPVGYVIVASKYPGVPASEHVQQLKGLAVSPQLQGQGAGRRLVMEAAATARRRGARRLTLNVLGTNAIARASSERTPSRANCMSDAALLLKECIPRSFIWVDNMWTT